jgi:hypothetical protein
LVKKARKRSVEGAKAKGNDALLALRLQAAVN